MRNLLIVFLFASLATTAARAGTTGIITGTITDIQGATVANVRVVASSPSDREATTSDAQGHFAFLRLAPDTYTISLERADYYRSFYVGVVVFADTTLPLTMKMDKIDKRIGKLMDRVDPLVRGGIGADVYLIQSNQLNAFQDALHVSLTAIPGITVGTGDPIPH